MSKYELTYRSTKGSPLTPDEIDTNFKRIKNGHDSIDNNVTKLDHVVNVTYKNQIAGLSSQISQFEGRVSTLRVDLTEQTEKLAQEAKKLNDLILEGLGGALDVNVSVDLSNYYTKSETNTAIQTALNNINLSNYYTKSEVDAKFTTSGTFDPTQYYTKNDVDGLIPTTFSGDYNDLSNKPTLPDLTPYALKTEIPTTFSGDYNDLSNKPYTPTEELINTMVQDIYDLNAETFPDKLPTPVINITPTAATLLEAGEVSNQVITFTILAQNTIFSEPLTWNISGTNIDTDDFASVELDGEPIDISSLSGSISDSTQSHTLKVTIARDEKSEGGNEVFTLTVSHNRNGSITVTERDVTIIDNSLDSEIRSVSWGGPDSGATLFEHLRDTANSNMWVQDFDISELKISTEEKAQLKEDALELDYTTLINSGLTYNDVSSIVNNVIEESVSVLNAVVDATFGTESTVIVDGGTMHFISHDTDTLEARPSNNRLYIRNSAAAYTDIVYAETYNIADVNAQVETFVDTYLAEFDWSSVGLTGTEQEIQQVKDIIIAFTDIIIPLVIDMAEAMSTTVNLYGYRKLTAGS
jgi:hypothetical protein